MKKLIITLLATFMLIFTGCEKDDPMVRKTTMTIYECNPTCAEDNEIQGYPVSGAELKLYIEENGRYSFVRTFKSDKNGKCAIGLYFDKSYYYTVSKGESSNLYRGYVIQGAYVDMVDVFNSPSQLILEAKPGGLKLKDLNGDGVINEKDKVDQYAPLLFDDYEYEEDMELYMAPETF